MAIDIHLYFNFRSPYCYLASKSLWRLFEDYDAELIWRPLGGWDGRSSPDRAKIKVPITRQDVTRWARRMEIPIEFPPLSTEPTRAGAGSLLAEEEGLLKPYMTEVMHTEWGEGRDIGDADVLLAAGEKAGLDRAALAEAMDDPARQAQLQANWQEAQQKGVMGVPTFVIGEEIFWGNDRIEFVEDYLREHAA